MHQGALSLGMLCTYVHCMRAHICMYWVSTTPRYCTLLVGPFAWSQQAACIGVLSIIVSNYRGGQ